jgi:CheY-like chemotaxis protein
LSAEHRLAATTAVDGTPHWPSCATAPHAPSRTRSPSSTCTCRTSTALPKPIGPSQLYNGLLEILDPRIDATRHPAAVRPVDGPDHGRVLLAEDNAINQLLAVDTLEMLGYRVDVAGNGMEAVELAATNAYQAVLMDCQMPKMDGFAATAELRRREGDDRHTPIIAMTAGALAEDRDRCFAAGMDDHLSKPIDPEELNAALQRWITDVHHA